MTTSEKRSTSDLLGPNWRAAGECPAKSETFILEVSKRNNAIAGGRTMLKWADGILDMTSQIGTEEEWQDMVHEAAVSLAIECAEGTLPVVTSI